MARRAKPKRPDKASIKRAADRAEARAKGVDLEAEETKPTIGRPTDYDPSFCDIAASACARGATINELADMLKVNRATVYRWMAQHQTFCDAINIAREMADKRVGFSLYERAVGYTYDSVKIMQSEGVPLIVPYQEHVPPDVSAIKWWQSNRDPENWRERSSVEHTGKGGGPIQVSNETDLALARRIAFAMSQSLVRGAVIDVTPGKDSEA